MTVTVTQKTWIIIGSAIVVALIYYLQPILTPFLASFILAYLGNPLVDRLERWKLPRTLAVVMVLLVMVLLLGLVLLLLIPMVVREFTALFARLPQAWTWTQMHVLPWLALHLHVDLRTFAPTQFADMMKRNFASAGKLASTLGSVSRSGTVVFIFFMNLLLIPVVTFYLLRDWHRLMARIEALLPRVAAPTVTQLARDCDGVLAGFLRGQLLVMACLGITYTLGLSIIGLDSAVAIGVIAGLLSFVPYLGFFTGVGLALLSALLQGQGWLLPVEVLVVFGIGEALESFVFTPNIIGERIGLHPVLVIFAILAGGELFGFAGVLLALPAAAAGTVLVRHAHGRYLQSRLYQDTGNDAS